VTFNSPQFLQTQIRLLRKYIKNDFDIKIVDNSDNSYHIESIKFICLNEYISYETHYNPYTASTQHANSLNYMYNKYSKQYDYIVLLDHDIFLYDYLDFNDFNDNKFVGIKQERNGMVYLWPGCLIINNLLYGKYDCNFLPINGTDTGGSLKDIINSEIQYVKFIEEKHIDSNFNGNYYTFYSEIDNKWFHFINGSNWNNQENEEERINLLFDILENKLV